MIKNRGPYFELHITMESTDTALTRAYVEGLGWKFSSIEDDIILGPGVKCYATAHLNSIKNTQRDAEDFLESGVKYLSKLPHKVLRKKVELVTYDVRMDQ